MSHPPLISICLPNLNTRPFLDERMESLLAQTLPDWELIICDSFSDDGSWEFFQQFRNDARIRMEQVPREGLYAGWNECLRRARGEYIYIATSDDGAQPDLLEKLVAPLEQFPAYHLAYCDFEPINEQSQPIELRFRQNYRDFFGDWLNQQHVRSGLTEWLLLLTLGPTWFTENTILFRRRLLEQTGLFATHLGSFADSVWNLRACLATDVVYVPGRMAKWRLHSRQATPNRIGLSDMQASHRCRQQAWADCEPKLPPAWKLVPHWKQRITRCAHHEYLDSYNLFRGFARRHPGQFLANASQALVHEPKFLLTQAACGFRWEPKFSPNRIEAALELIHLFQTPWPPQPLPAIPATQAAQVPP